MRARQGTAFTVRMSVGAHRQFADADQSGRDRCARSNIDSGHPHYRRFLIESLTGTPADGFSCAAARSYYKQVAMTPSSRPSPPNGSGTPTRSTNSRSAVQLPPDPTHGAGRTG